MSRESILSRLERLEALGGAADLDALEAVLAERIRQMEAEGWSPDWDDRERRRGQLASAAASYALSVAQKAVVHARTGSLDVKPSAPHAAWPFPMLAWKPASMRRMAVKANALLLAELARQIRAGIA
jgi:hypothetical protein